MRRSQSKIEKEGLPSLRGVLHSTDRPPRQFRKNLHQFPTRKHRTWPVKSTSAPLINGVRQTNSPIVFQKAIRRIIRHISPKIRIETSRDRSAADRLGEVHIAESIASHIGWRAILRRPLPSEMPLPNAMRGITMLLQKSRNGQSLRLDQRSVPRPKHPTLQPSTPSISPSEQRVARRSTHSCRRVSIGKTHPFFR